VTSNQMDKSQPQNQAVALPGRVGQGTAIEQARAMAEVHAAMLISREMPRSIQTAISEMQQSCSQMALANRASYRFPRAGGAVTGPSVYLARELARCWGNIQHGITELRRDDEYGQSEMQAWAWDVQLNTRSSSTFIVPHKRDKKGGAERLTDMRDIYENNANNGARRLREAIFSVIPDWFVEQAIEVCSQTLKEGGGVPLPQRVSRAIKAFEGFGVSKLQLEQKVGRPTDDWNEYDVAQLTVIYTSLQRREVSVADEFPEERVTADEVKVTAAEVTGGGKPTESVAPDSSFDDAGWLAGGEQG
jgi:hypothetical protein